MLLPESHADLHHDDCSLVTTGSLSLALLRVLPVASSPIRARMQAQGFQYIQVLSVQCEDDQKVLRALPQGAQFIAVRQVNDACSRITTTDDTFYYTSARFPNLQTACLQLPARGYILDIHDHAKLKTLQLTVASYLDIDLMPIMIPKQCLVSLDMTLGRTNIFKSASFCNLQHSLRHLSVHMGDLAVYHIHEVDLCNFTELSTLYLYCDPAPWRRIKLPKQCTLHLAMQLCDVDEFSLAECEGYHSAIQTLHVSLPTPADCASIFAQLSQTIMTGLKHLCIASDKFGPDYTLSLVDLQSLSHSVETVICQHCAVGTDVVLSGNWQVQCEHAQCRQMPPVYPRVPLPGRVYAPQQLLLGRISRSVAA